MQVNLYQSGERKVGFTLMIPEGGFNGTVDIIWVDDQLTNTSGQHRRAILINQLPQGLYVLSLEAYTNGKLMHREVTKLIKQ